MPPSQVLPKLCPTRKKVLARAMESLKQDRASIASSAKSAAKQTAQNFLRSHTTLQATKLRLSTLSNADIQRKLVKSEASLQSDRKENRIPVGSHELTSPQHQHDGISREELNVNFPKNKIRLPYKNTKSKVSSSSGTDWDHALTSFRHGYDQNVNVTAQHAAAVSSAESQPLEDDVRTQPQNDGILREKLNVNIPKKKIQPKKNTAVSPAVSRPTEYGVSVPSPFPTVEITEPRRKSRTKQAESIQTFDTLSVITTQNAKLRGRLKIKIPNFEPILSRDALSVQHELFSDEYISYITVLLKRDRIDEAREAINVFMLGARNKIRIFNKKRLYSPVVHTKLIRGYAPKDRFEDAWSLLNSMYEAEVVPTMETYLWLLYAAVKSSSDGHLKAHKVIEEIYIHGLGDKLTDFLNDELFSAYVQEGDEMVQKLREWFPELKFRERTIDRSMYDYSYNNLVSDINLHKGFPNPLYGVMTKYKAQQQLRKQIEVEKEGGVRIAIEELPPSPSPRYQEANDLLASLWTRWENELRDHVDIALEKFKEETLKVPRGGHRVSIYEYLMCTPKELIVESLIHQVQQWCIEGALQDKSSVVSGRYLSIRLQARILNSIHSRDRYYEQMTEVYDKFNDQCFNNPTMETSYRESYNSCDTGQVYRRNSLDNPFWMKTTSKSVGRVMLDMVLHSLTLPSELLHFDDEHDSSLQTVTGDEDETAKAFYLSYGFEDKEAVYRLKAHPKLEKFISNHCHQTHMHTMSTYLPSLVPPIPWLQPNLGMFIRQTGRTVKQFEQGGETGDPKELGALLDALNYVSMTAWKINPYIHNHVLSVFRSGGDVNLKIPRQPSSINVSDTMITDEGRYSRKMMTSLVEKKKREQHAERCSYSLSLSVVNFVKDDMFWFPTYMDFRGRVYASCGLFSVTSESSKRAMLQFAKGKPLGERGLEWLKIHLVNQTGFKKRDSNKTRLEYADEMLDRAFQSAETPFKGNQWWQEFDDPWLGLAACKELKAAYDSGDPVNYVSHLPIHQDGSCNGLQHYAAMGRDQLGGESVNLTPCDTPRDTYTNFANFIEKLRVEDAAKGNLLAQKLEGLITRKVVKQTVMTQVYGVTPYGARLQIHKQLKALKPSHIDSDELLACSQYISGLLSDAMATMFTSSTDIQGWLTLSATLISRHIGKPVEWKTPLGLRCVQNYFKRYDTEGSVSVMKQRNSFPPNFIHSLDSTHMLLTALRCHQEGIVFSSVHDCYWTHACDIDRMNEITRDTFISIYKQPILNNLAGHFRMTYTSPDMNSEKTRILQQLFQSIPTPGKLDLDEVKNAEYFFS